MKLKHIALALAACALLSGCHEHTWAEATCIAPQTCSECEETEGEALPHNLTEASCLPPTCTDCGTIVGEAVMEHNWTRPNCTTAKTCQNCGSTDGEPSPHIWVEATCSAPKTCGGCHITEGEALPHTFVPAQCTQKPYCSVCSDFGEVGSHNVVDGVCIDCNRSGIAVLSLDEIAGYFGLESAPKWTEDAQTEEDIINNQLYNALTNNYETDVANGSTFLAHNDRNKMRSLLMSTHTLYNSILGAYVNAIQGDTMSGGYYLSYEPMVLSEEEVYDQTFAALDKALKIKEELHSNGTITDNMSQFEIVKVYYNYLINNGYGNKAGGGPELRGTGKNMLYDSAYACLINKNAACGGRSAAFNLLMHVEGITAHGIRGRMNNNGHIISRVVADGKEYFVDWGNRKPIGNYEDTSKWFNFNYEDGKMYLEMARAAGGEYTEAESMTAEVPNTPNTPSTSTAVPNPAPSTKPAVHPNAAYAKYFGINPNIKWVENPSTRNELINNILWNALNGEYSFDFIASTSYYRQHSKEIFSLLDHVCLVYPEIMGAYANVITGGRSGSEVFEIYYDADPLPLTEKQVYEQNLTALNQALKISKKLHDNGTITDDMSQLDIAKVYYDYLQDAGIKGRRESSLKGTGKDMLLDTAYACLINKNAMCVGKAAGFNLLMHVEGISAQGVGGQFIGQDTGHVISRIVADGKEYFVDWGNDKPIGNYEKTSTWFDFNYEHNRGTLEMARAAG